jgi:hypothetical protein
MPRTKKKQQEITTDEPSTQPENEFIATSQDQQTELPPTVEGLARSLVEFSNKQSNPTPLPAGQFELRQQLVLLTDAYIKLTENDTWLEFAEKFPELEQLRQEAIEASDNLWWRYRTKCADFNSL